MPSTTRRRTLQTATLLLLLMNFALTVNAGPIGDAAISLSRYYWILILFCLLVLAVILSLEKRKSPIDILGLTYDKNTNKLELTVKNNDSNPYCIKSALRLIQPALNAVADNVSEDGVPMSAASTTTRERRMFDLLSEDEEAVVIEPNETKVLAYDVILPPEHVDLESNKNVEVHISYGEDLRHMGGELEGEENIDIVRGEGMEGQLEAQPGAEVQLETPEEKAVAAAYLVQELADAVKNSPAESVEFHMKYENAVAKWVRDVAKDEELAGRIMSIKTETPGELKNELLRVLVEKIESDEHPYLKAVSNEESFKLKLDHNEVISEIFLLEDLAEAIETSPDQAIEFHTRDVNDFANWVKYSIGDRLLADAIEEIKGEPKDVKRQLAETIKPRIMQLKRQQA